MRYSEAVALVHDSLQISRTGERPLLTKSEVNRILGYNGGTNGQYGTVENLIKNNLLRSVKLKTGGRRILTSSLIEFLADEVEEAIHF